MGESGGISLQDRLASMDGRLSEIIDKIDVNSNRMTKLEAYNAQNAERISSLESSRDWFTRLIVGAVVMTGLGVIGLVKYGH